MAGTDTMRLVGDLGGTHCRLAIAGTDGSLADIQTFKAADYPSVEAAISAYLKTTDVVPAAACLAVAGPTARDAMLMTNLSWRTTDKALNEQFGFSQSAFINDFEAIALSIPALTNDDLMTIGAHSESDKLKLSLPISVIGPGTGLGVAQLLSIDNHVRAIPTEGGHTSLQTETAIEQQIFTYWRERGLPPSRESFLSGPGLFRIYCALCALEKKETRAKDGGHVSEFAAGGDRLAKQALEVFLALLGSAAGDQALACGSRGGIVLAGGILPKIRKELSESDFRKRFENKAPMQHYLSEIPTSLILHDNPGLLGASLFSLD